MGKGCAEDPAIVYWMGVWTLALKVLNAPLAHPMPSLWLLRPVGFTSTRNRLWVTARLLLRQSEPVSPVRRHIFGRTWAVRARGPSPSLLRGDTLNGGPPENAPALRKGG